VTVSQKILCSFLLSALLCAGIAALALTGILAGYGDIAAGSAQIVMFVAVFLTLFLLIFFCFNLRRDSAEEPEEIETVEEISADAVSLDVMSAEAVQVEIVTGLSGNFMFKQPFTFTPGDPELLQGAESQEAGISGEVVYEENGIHYINGNVFVDDEKREEFDNNFAELVESVVNNKEFELT